MNTDKRSGICQQCSFSTVHGYNLLMEDLQTSELNCIHAKDKFRAIYIVKVHVKVVDEVVTKMRISAGGRLTVNGIQLRI